MIEKNTKEKLRDQDKSEKQFEENIYEINK